MGERIQREKQPTKYKLLNNKIKDFNATHKTAPHKGGGVKKQRSKQKARKRPEFALFILCKYKHTQNNPKNSPKTHETTTGGQFINQTQKQRTARTRARKKHQAKGTPENGKKPRAKKERQPNQKRDAKTPAPKDAKRDTKRQGKGKE